MNFWSSIFCFLLLNISMLSGQTCCSGGVPVSANLGLPTGDKYQFQFSLSADLNHLQTLKSGTRIIDDKSRTRNTNAMLLELGYSFSDRFSVDIFGAFVQQKRFIENGIGTDLEVTNGLGDWVTLAKYKVIAKKERSLTAGIGIKWPLGPADLLSKRNLPLNADLQPGSGALDGIGWLSFQQQFKKRPSLNWISTAVYSIKGKNEKYLGDAIYQFGNELQISSGLADQFLIGKILLDAAILFRYRLANRDEFDLEVLPNTGGDFLFLNPGLTYWISQKTNVFFNINIPIYSNVDGTQLAPTYQLNFGFYYSVSLKNNLQTIN